MADERVLVEVELPRDEGATPGPASNDPRDVGPFDDILERIRGLRNRTDRILDRLGGGGGDDDDSGLGSGALESAAKSVPKLGRFGPRIAQAIGPAGAATLLGVGAAAAAITALIAASEKAAQAVEEFADNAVSASGELQAIQAQADRSVFLRQRELATENRDIAQRAIAGRTGLEISRIERQAEIAELVSPIATAFREGQTQLVELQTMLLQVINGVVDSEGFQAFLRVVAPVSTALLKWLNDSASERARQQLLESQISLDEFFSVFFNENQFLDRQRQQRENANPQPNGPGPGVGGILP